MRGLHITLCRVWRLLRVPSIVLSFSLPLCAQPISLQELVTPSTTVVKDGRPVTFAVHGFIEFKSLAELFPYIDSQMQRWKVRGGLDEEQRGQLARELLRRGIESRVISMEDERPLEALITHTSDELRRAVALVKDPLPVWVRRSVSGSTREVEAFPELLERLAVYPGTRAVELVSD